jgi:hypothetical protein
VAVLDVKVIAPARAITVFSLLATGTFEVFAALDGTPSAAIHASVPCLTQSSYGSTPKPQLPQTRPHDEAGLVVPDERERVTAKGVGLLDRVDHRQRGMTGDRFLARLDGPAVVHVAGDVDRADLADRSLHVHDG